MKLAGKNIVVYAYGVRRKFGFRARWHSGVEFYANSTRRLYNINRSPTSRRGGGSHERRRALRDVSCEDEGQSREDNASITQSSPLWSFEQLKATTDRITACITCTLILRGPIGMIKLETGLTNNQLGSVLHAFYIRMSVSVRTAAKRSASNEVRGFSLQASQLILITSTLVSGFWGFPVRRVLN